MQLLMKRRVSVVTAESCTAGSIAAVLSEAEGASTCLHGGFVTYTKAQKSAALGLPAELLASRGSVNEEVVCRMVQGALARSPAAIGLAVTGVLGPDDDEDGNPVGLVFFACCRRGQSPKVVEKRFPPAGADRLRETAVIVALDLIEEVAATAS
jgi:nicotinamide-nucleotide amidase